MKKIIEKFAFDVSVSPPRYVEQILASDDGKLTHHVDGQLRAVVAPENVGDYLGAPSVAQAFAEAERIKAFVEFNPA